MSFEIKNDVLVKYTGNDTVVTIPDGVTRIEKCAFQNCRAIKQINIPNSVTQIGGGMFNGAFGNCTALAQINIPDSVTKLGGYAFEGCVSLKEINIPDGVKSIGSAAFKGCASLMQLHIPDSVKWIGDVAFAGCKSLTHINIPDGVTEIRWGTFSGCESLTSIHIPDSVKTISERAFRGCKGLCDEKGFVIIKGVLYDYLGSDIYIQIPDGVVKIDEYAFFNSTVFKQISISNSVKTISARAFEGCTALEDISVSGSLQKVSSVAFDKCTSLRSITAFETSIEVFQTANLILQASMGYFENTEKYTNQDVAAAYEKYALSQSKRLLPLVFADDAVAAIAFYERNGKITKKNIDTVFLTPAIEAKATKCVAYLLEWKNKNLTFEDIEKQFEKELIKDVYNREDMRKLWSFKKQDDGTFMITNYKGQATVVTVPMRIGKIPVTGLGKDVFANNKELESVTVPKGVRSIGDRAFMGCASLKELNLPSGISKMGCAVFADCRSLADDKGFLVIKGILHCYFGVDVHAHIPEGVKKIGNGVFWGHHSLTSVHIPEGVRSIGDNAFLGCKSLTSINIPDSVTKIGCGAFSGCASLTSVHIPDGVTALGSYSFSRCYSLEKIHIPCGVKSIGSGAFESCKSLKIITPKGSYAEKFAKKNGIPVENC